MHVHFVSSNEEQYEIMLHFDNNCVCKRIRLMSQLKLYQFCISLYNILDIKIKV